MSLNNSIKKKILKKKIKKKKYITFDYSGKSMFPTLKEGYRLTIAKPDNIDIGNLIAFSRNDKLICHRFVGKINNKYYTKGDNQENIDHSLLKEDIIGKVIEIKDKKGKQINLRQLGKKNKILLKVYLLSYSCVKKLFEVSIIKKSFGRCSQILKKKFNNIMSKAC